MVVIRILDVDILLVEDFWELLPYERDLETPSWVVISAWNFHWVQGSLAMEISCL